MRHKSMTAVAKRVQHHMDKAAMHNEKAMGHHAKAKEQMVLMKGEKEETVKGAKKMMKKRK